jgi:serine/threonine protein kinase
MDQIGRYRIIGELGRGAMGVVYHATDPSIGRPVAIKTIRIRDINDTQQRDRLRERLFREARSAGVLSHPNIVTIYDMDEADGLAYIAMAFVNGPTLEKMLASEQPLSGARMLRILRQTASALDYAHTKSIVHRDVKPANIMTDEDGSVKITDFGIARITAGIHSTDTTTVAGTPNYMSPEQVQGLPLDGRSDQFSLAVIAYEILTGERPFVGEHLSTIIFRIVAESPPPAHRLNGTLTPQIDEVLRKGLAKKPDERFANCANFVGALELACAESRGWKTLPAGAAAALPTLSHTVEAQVPGGLERVPGAKSGQTPVLRLRRSEPPKRRVLLPVLLGTSVVVSAAALAMLKWGVFTGSTPPPAEQVQVQEPQSPLNPSGQSISADPQTQPGSARAEAQQAAAPEASAGNPQASAETPPGPQSDAGQAETAAGGPIAPKPQNSSAEPNSSERNPVERAPDEKIVANEPGTDRIPPVRLQDVWVTTNPPGAKVVLDDNLGQACAAPCMLHGVTGTHHLTVSLAGFLNEYREIHIGTTALDVPQISLRQPTGTLWLTTIPTGASVRIDGKLIAQTTPAQISLAPGTYSVTVERDGVARTEKIQLRDSSYYLKIPLEPF